MWYGEWTPNLIGSLLGLLIALLLVQLIGSVGGRLLGVRQSWWRTLVVGVLGLSVGAGFAAAVGAQHLGNAVTPLVFFSFILIATMLFSMSFELLAVPAGSAISGTARSRRVPALHPIQRLRRRWSRWSRYLRITSIIARHGLLPYIGGRRRSVAANWPDVSGRTSDTRALWSQVRGALEEAGGAFVKLGQVLSTRPDLLPPEAIAELSSLQDRVAPAPQAEIEAILVAELGVDTSKVFAMFDPTPLAAASIAQVYRARLTSGEQVVVKVQRPGIREPVERDLDILLDLARTIERRAAWARAFGVVDLAEGFATALREELDFLVEARNTAAALAAAPQHNGTSLGMTAPAVHIPRVFPRHSSDRVLVVEWLDGVSVREVGTVVEELGLARPVLARTLLRCFLYQILRTGTFHADPHPGNVLVLRDGSLALIDFGSVGRLDAVTQNALQRMLIALDRRDAVLLTDALLEIAIGTAGWSGMEEERLERALAHLLAQRLGPGMAPGPKLFADLFALLFEFGLAFPPIVGGVFRTLVTLQGTLEVLAPEFQFVDEARGMGGELVQAALAPTSLHDAATEQLVNLLPILQRLPRRLDRITAAIERGSLSVNVRILADERDARLISGLVSRAVLAFLGAAVGLMSVMLLSARGGPMLSATLPVYQLFGYCGLFASIVLILRVLAGIVRERAR